jgi:hypothetical protein
MTIAEQMQRFHAALAPWAQERGGTAAKAFDQVHALELLQLKPGGLLVAVMFESEDPRGENDELGRVDRNFKVIVSRGRGFRLDTGESLVEQTSGGPPMFDLVEEAREVARRIRFNEDTTEVNPEYKGSGPFTVEGFVLDAFEVRFSIGTQIPTWEDIENEEQAE